MSKAAKPTVQIGTRLPSDLHARVKRIAEKEARTVAKQIVKLLDAGCRQYEQANP
jgi:hypothetical protein